MTLQSSLSHAIGSAMSGFQMRSKVAQLARESAIEAGIPGSEIEAFVQAVTASLDAQPTESV